MEEILDDEEELPRGAGPCRHFAKELPEGSGIQRRFLDHKWSRGGGKWVSAWEAKVAAREAAVLEARQLEFAR